MAARAGLRRGHRQARIKVKLLAERHLLRRVGVFLGKGIDAGRRYSAFIASMPTAAFWPRSIRRVSPTMAAPKPMLAKPNRPRVVAATAVPNAVDRPTLDPSILHPSRPFLRPDRT